MKFVNYVPSPLVPLEEIEHILIDAIGDAGAIGGAVGGSASGAVGGRAGGRFGAKHFNKLDGLAVTFPVPPTDAYRHLVRDQFLGGVPEQYGVGPGTHDQAYMMVGLVGSGALNMNPCHIQIVWFETSLHVTAYAKEAWIKQKTCVKAIDRLAEVLQVRPNGTGPTTSG